MKLIALLYVMAVQLLTASAFTARSVHNNINNRHVVVSTSTAQFMAVATPAAPVKEKVKKVTNESDNESEKAKDRGWLVRLYNDVSILLEAMYLCIFSLVHICIQYVDYLLFTHQIFTNKIMIVHKLLLR